MRSYFDIKNLTRNKIIEACDENDEYMHLHKIAVNLAIDAGISPNITVYVYKNYDSAGTASLWPSHPWIYVDKDLAGLMPLNEFAAVIAHELGHIKANDMFFSKCFKNLPLPLMLANYNSLPIMLLTFPFFHFVGKLYSRHRERQADRFSAKLVGSSFLTEFFERGSQM